MVIKWLSHVFLSEKLKLQSNTHYTMPLLFKMYMLIYIHIYVYRYESWTVKKVECQRIDAFELGVR